MWYPARVVRLVKKGGVWGEHASWVSIIDFLGREERSARVCWGRLLVANIEPGRTYPVTIDIRFAFRVT